MSFNAKPHSGQFLVMLSLMANAWVANVFGQTGLNVNPEFQGDQYFSAEQYFRAARYYEATLEADSSNYEVAFKLAESYRLQFDYTNALSWYQYVSGNSQQLYPEATFLQAVMLKQLGRCKKSIEVVNSLLGNTGEVPARTQEQADALKKSCEEWLIAQSVSNHLSLVKLGEPINSSNYDYAPVLLGSDSALLITSTRFSGKQKMSYRFGENNANFFQFTMLNGSWKTENGLPKVLNTRASEGSGSYCATRGEFYFTFCPENEPCQLYYTWKKSGEWQNPLAVSSSINLAGYNSKHPAITPQGDTLFFASDRPGGKGGLDIWMSLRTKEGEWTPPVCLDTLVNTSADEVSPFFLPQEDLLVFGSKGHQSYGGMDLFYVSDFSNLAQRLRVQLPDPFNSSTDDSYLILGNGTGYLTSNRGGNFDIYRFARNRSQSWENVLAGVLPAMIVSEETNSNNYFPRSDDISVLPEELNSWVRVQTVSQKRLASGSTRFVLNSDVNDIRFREYQLSRQQDSTPTFTVIANSTEPLSDENSILLATFSFDSLELGEKGVITGKLSSAAKPEVPVREQSLQLLDAQGQLLKVSSTNTDGDFRFVNLSSNTEYSLALVLNSAEDSVLLKNFRIEENPAYELAQTYEPIYFDFNQDRLRPEAKKVLESIADLYQSNPSLSIEINAYTDSLGNAQYNYLLSQQRGEEAFQYLISQGVDRASLVLNAKGVSTSYKSTNAFVSQQLNRRVEFTIFGLENDLKQKAITRILRPKVELKTLLQRTGMTVKELHSLNGRPVDALQPYKPIRIVPTDIPDYKELFYQVIDIN